MGKKSNKKELVGYKINLIILFVATIGFPFIGGMRYANGMESNGGFLLIVGGLCLVLIIELAAVIGIKSLYEGA
jgi:hypothetical protein